MKRLKFSDVKKKVDISPGLYKIITTDHLVLKIGISKNLRSRLLQHANSRDSGLKKTIDGDIEKPSDLSSKGSVLAKHLYFDKTISSKYGFDLTTEIGRRSFLEQRCYLQIEYTPTKAYARDKERIEEASGKYRYVGRVMIR